MPDGDYVSAIKRFSGKEYAPGDFVDIKGNVLGRHKGIVCYTIGQRKGLGISASNPLYVLRIDVENNRVVLGSNEDLFTRTAFVEDVNWIVPPVSGRDVQCKAKVRYRMQEKPCTVMPLGEGRCRLVFDEPQRAITPGQSAVFYDGDVVLGGGIISARRCSEISFKNSGKG